MKRVALKDPIWMRTIGKRWLQGKQGFSHRALELSHVELSIIRISVRELLTGDAVANLDFRQFQKQNSPKQPDKPNVLRGVRQPKNTNPPEIAQETPRLPVCAMPRRAAKFNVEAM